jgi:hypothetical protein
MSQSLEDLVRAVQHEQAERAVDPRRVLAALPQRRVRAVRRRRLVLAGVAAAVAAVVAVPVFALRQGPAPQPPSATPGPSVSPAPGQLVPLKYSPGWLPAGYAEYSRTIRPPGSLNRAWAAAPPTSPVRLSELTGILSMTVGGAADATEDASGETVDINGVRGVYRAEEPSRVTWQLDGTRISIGMLKPLLPKDTLLRIARSVRPDPAAMELPLTMRVPAGQSIAGQSMTGVSAGEWLATTTLGELTPSGGLAELGATISVGTMTRASAGGTALRVAGHPARYVRNTASRTGHFLVVDLDGGLKLTVYSEDLDQPALVALAEAVNPPNPGAVAWIGS